VRAAEFLVPVQDRLGRREGIGASTEKLAVEDAIGVGVGDHEIADPQVFTGALFEHRRRRAVPLPVSVVRVNVILAAVPAALGSVRPAFEFDLRSLGLPGGDGNRLMHDPVFGPAKDAHAVFTGRQRQLRLRSQ
jgi:hypothetical protein